MIKLYLLLLGIALYSCEQKQNQVPQIQSDKPKLTYSPSGPDIAVFDLLPVNGDTLIAVKWHGGLAFTTDAGVHWQNLHDQPTKPDFLYIKYLTIDNHHVLWGLDSWGGIHEPPYSRLAYSIDFGKKWTRHEFDTHKFFPYNFYSYPSHALQILTRDAKVYQLKDRIGKDWKFIKSVAELNNSVNDTTYDDSYFINARFKFLETGQLFSRIRNKWIPITKVSFINELNDVCPCAGSIYIVGFNNAASPTPHYLLRITNGQLRDTVVLPNEDQKYLRCDNRGRLWLFNYEGIWVKSGHKFYKRY